MRRRRRADIAVRAHEAEHGVVGVVAPVKRPFGIAEAVAVDHERPVAVAVALCHARRDACAVAAECEEDVMRAAQHVVQTRRLAAGARSRAARRSLRPHSMRTSASAYQRGG